MAATLAIDAEGIPIFDPAGEVLYIIAGAVSSQDGCWKLVRG